MPPERKRANVFGEDEPTTSPKRMKGNAPAAPSYLPPPMSAAPPPPTGAPPASIGIDIAAKRAEIQAKLAAMRAAATPGPSATPSPPPPPSSVPPRPPSGSGSPAGLPPVPGLPKPNLDPDLAKKVAEAKRLVESMQARKAALQKPANPYLGSAAPSKSDPVVDAAIANRGGLSMAAHPLLMDTSAPVAQTKKDRYKPMVPKFSTTKANARLPPPPPKIAPLPVAAPQEDLADTPFYDPRLSYGSAGTAGKQHMGRGHARSTFKFNQKGKFVRLGEAIRAEAKMEELKKRILESAKKAGLENELEDQAKAVKRPPPPDVEWWDTPFLPEKSYDSVSSDYLDTSGAITIYVQHPIQIPAPGDKIKVAERPLDLTKAERKKMRRQRRKAALEDTQDRIKMGLIAPPPPKVKLSNMMRVLTQEAIADPTKIEAKVRREMDARKKGHERANAERKLTDEQKAEKEQAKREKDETRGIQAACFKVRYLSNPSHKFKVQRNAVDQGLTGVTLFNPKFCLVLVEGGPKAVKFYKHLMMKRINWTEEALPRAGDEEAEVGVSTSAGAGPSGTAMDDLEEPESLADNTCSLIWEGQHREKMFGFFKRYNCPSEAKAKEVLGPKLEGLWDVAKTDKKEEDD